jgi:hypothetical protein
MVGQEAGQDGRICMMFDDRLMDTAADFSCLGRECWLQDVAVVASSLRGKSCSVLRVYRDRCCDFVIDRLTTIKVERTVFFFDPHRFPAHRTLCWWFICTACAWAAASFSKHKTEIGLPGGRGRVNVADRLQVSVLDRDVFALCCVSFWRDKTHRPMFLV